MIPTPTDAICWSSTAPPLTTITPWSNDAPVTAAPRPAVNVGGRSPGYTRYVAVAPLVDGSCCPALSQAQAVTLYVPCAARFTGSVHVVLVAPGAAIVANSVL